MPASYGLVQTDPRGVGCNLTDPVDAASFFSTEEIAGDVVAAITHLRAEHGMQRFILHGHSYGTVLATHVAHELAEPNAPKPEAVILEGVMGRAFTDEWMAASYVEAWKYQKERLSLKALEALREPSPLGFDAKTWGNFFMVVSSQLGSEATHGVLSLLEPDESGQPIAANREQLRALVEQLGTIDVNPGPGLVLQKWVACRELTRDLPEDNIDVVLEGGELVKSPDAGGLCSGIPLAKPYHVKEHLFPFRTFYFLGDHDTATPMWQGKLHFDALTTAERVEVVVKGGGHLPLHRHLVECGPSLVERIAEGSGFGDALGACGVDVDVRYAQAGSP